MIKREFKTRAATNIFINRIIKRADVSRIDIKMDKKVIKVEYNTVLLNCTNNKDYLVSADTKIFDDIKLAEDISNILLDEVNVLNTDVVDYCGYYIYYEDALYGDCILTVDDFEIYKEYSSVFRDSKTTMCKDVLDFVMKQEGLRLKAYKCPAGVLTIGYGHTNNGVGPIFDIDTVWTRNDALFAFIADFQIAFDAVGDRSHGIITNCQQSVLASWTYNVGIGAMQRSTLMKCISKHQLYHVPRELARWNKSGGKTIKGLTNRRKAEIELWNKCCKN